MTAFTQFSALTPPWSLPSLDANFALAGNTSARNVLTSQGDQVQLTNDASPASQGVGDTITSGTLWTVFGSSATTVPMIYWQHNLLCTVVAGVSVVARVEAATGQLWGIDESGVMRYFNVATGAAGSTVAAGDFTQTASLDISTGNAVFSGIINANGGQIQFPATQNPSSNANCLDDYEEGTATITVVPLAGAFATINYAGQTMRYTKLGNKVFWSLYLTASGVTLGTAAGAALVSGLPYAASVPASSYDYGAVGQCDVGAVSTDFYAKPQYFDASTTFRLVLTTKSTLTAANIVTATGVVLAMQGSYTTV